MSDTTSTQALVKKVQAGDQDALNSLYGRYVPRILAAVRIRLGAELRGKVESWDILQDAMFASLKNVQAFNYDGEGAFLNWLSKIVENRIRDHIDFQRAEKRDHRREKPLGRSDGDSVPLIDVEASGLPSPSRILALREDLSLLETALDRLTPEIRELIVATKLEGRSYTEIAQSQGKSPDAVRMQVNRALVALTKQFQQIEAEGGLK